MGVDHTAVAGVGFQIDLEKWLETEISEKEEYEGSIAEYLWDVLSDCDLYTEGEIGSGAYTGDDNEHYLFIKDSLLLGFTKVQEQEAALSAFMEKHNLEPVGVFGLHKGVHTH